MKTLLTELLSAIFHKPTENEKIEEMLTEDSMASAPGFLVRNIKPKVQSTFTPDNPVPFNNWHLHIHNELGRIGKGR